jgi:hypothetical protein
VGAKFDICTEGTHHEKTQGSGDTGGGKKTENQAQLLSAQFPYLSSPTPMLHGHMKMISAWINTISSDGEVLQTGLAPAQYSTANSIN